MKVSTGVCHGALLAGWLIPTLMFLVETAEGSTKWKDITEQKSKILFYWPGPGTPRATFKKGKTSTAFIEIGEWQARDELWPRATVMLSELGGDYLYVGGRSLRETIKKVFPTKEISFGTGGTTVNGIGKLEFQHFALRLVEELHCIGMQQFYGPLGEIPGEQTRGDSLIFGWYCAEASTALSQETVERFVQGIGVKGVASPRRTVGSVHGDGRGPYRIGIFPASGRFISRPNSEWDEAYAAHGLNAQIAANSALRVVYSHYERGLDQPRIRKPEKLWTHSGKPKLPTIYDEARMRSLDAVFIYRGTGFFVGYADNITGPMPIELYLIDVKEQRLYQRKGTTDNLASMIDGLFADFLQGDPQKRSSSSRTTRDSVTPEEYEFTRKVVCQIPGSEPQVLIYTTCLWHGGKILRDAN